MEEKSTGTPCPYVKTMRPHISHLFVYPVKSLRGIRVQESEVERRGLRYDRNWMVVDEEGRAMTERSTPRMASISTWIRDGELGLSAEGFGAVSAPLQAREETIQGTVKEWTGPVDLVNPEVDLWLSEVLATSSRLVKMRKDIQRTPINRNLWEVSFQDDAPILVLRDTSLEAMNRRLREPVEADRFRANIILAQETPVDDTYGGGYIAGKVSLAYQGLSKTAPAVMEQVEAGRPGGEFYHSQKDGYFQQTSPFGALYYPMDTGTIAVGDGMYLFDL